MPVSHLQCGLVTDFTLGEMCKNQCNIQKIKQDITHVGPHSNQSSNTMQCVEENEAADGRHADSYSQCAGGRGSGLPLAKELCINLGVKNVNR